MSLREYIRIESERHQRTGASEDSRAAFRAFVERGYDAVPVNPSGGEVEGRRAAVRVGEVQPPPEAALLMTPPAATDQVVRECAEETGALVEVGDLRLVREYIGRHHEFAREDHDAHQVELMFEARLVGNYAPGCGPVPDSSQVGVAWLPLAELGRHRLYPSVLRELLASGPAGPGEPGTAGVYLGDVN